MCMEARDNIPRHTSDLYQIAHFVYDHIAVAPCEIEQYSSGCPHNSQSNHADYFFSHCQVNKWLL